MGAHHGSAPHAFDAPGPKVNGNHVPVNGSNPLAGRPGASEPSTTPSAGDALEVERLRLESEIAAATARAAAAELRAAELNAALHAVVMASKERLAAIEREHETVLAGLRAAAQQQVEQIMAEARRQVSRQDQPSAVAGADHRPEVS